MFNTTRKLIRTAIVGTAAYYLYKEKPEEVKAVLNKVLPENVKKEIRKTKEQYESLQELKAAATDMTEGVARVAGEMTETLLKRLQTKEVEEQMDEIQKLRKQQKDHPEEFVPDTFTPHEVELLMSELPEDRMGWSIRIMLRTGIDMYEMLALTPWNIQTDGSMIRVSNQVKTKNGDLVIVPVKSDRNRMVPVPPDVRIYAKRLRKTDSEYVWQSRDSDLPIKPSSFTSQFKDHIGEVPQVRIFGPKVAVNTYEAEKESK